MLGHCLCCPRGFGCTGKLFAVEHYNIVPDLMTTAKSLAAVTGKADIMDAPHPGGLGGTYSGNPLACIVTIEAIGMIRQPEFLARATVVEQRMRGHMEAIKAENDLVGDVRGLGAMLAMELVYDHESKSPASAETSAINLETLKRGLITIQAGLYSNCVRFCQRSILRMSKSTKVWQLLLSQLGWSIIKDI